MTRKRTKRWTRRTAHQSAMLKEYEKLGYEDTGLNWDGTLVISKPCDRSKYTVIAIFRDGNTRVKSCDVGDHPHTVTYSKR